MNTINSITASLLLALLSSVGGAQDVVDQWRYTLRRPAEGWRQVDFDDSEWQEGFGGFGTLGTPGSRVGTTWTTNSIWLRKSFALKSVPERPALLIHHDEDTEVFMNGQPIAVLKEFTTKYIVVPLEAGNRSVLQVGNNTMAVHCKQTTGGQFIDAHLIDAANVPELPEPKRSTKPFVSELMTQWGEEVTAENAWTEYPRPLLQRDNWTNLNGHWDYAVTQIEQQNAPSEWDGEILVPYCLESKLGGVQRLLDATEALWYRRTFDTMKADGKRHLLNFEAVDYRCEVFVNGKSVGTHVGGNTPFSLDVTGAIKDGTNELVVRVEDATEEYQLRGKQVLNARGIWYTQVSGIWQTVWMEQVSESYIKDLKITTSASEGTISVDPVIVGDGDVEIEVRDGDRVVLRASGVEGASGTIDHAKLWSPESPHLYDVVVTVVDEADRQLDRVQSYAGIRDVGKVKDADGHWRLTLNGEPIFHWGPLDQGWWPDGLLTPPSDQAMLFDIEWLKAAGFNMIRKHIKVEPRRYYSHCDRLGMMVWQDHVSGGVGKAWPEWTRLKPNPLDATWPAAQHEQFMLELERMITTLESHPSIVSWVPFNERWGQHRTMEVGRWTVKRDPSRIINIASGGNFWPVGDVVDAHKYPHPEFPFEDGRGGRFDDYIKVMGEFGGHGYPVKGHLWDANRRNWGYGDLPKSEVEYKERYVTSLKMLNELRRQGIAAGVYTQTTDVEGEINGLMTYDRRVIKIPAADLAELHQVLFTETPQQAAKADQFTREAFIEVPTNRKPGPVMDADTIRTGLESHDRALYIKAGWIRDPYITLGPDDYYYLTGTQPREGDPREAENPYNIGLGDESIVGDQVRAWRSRDLIEWKSLGPIFTVDDTMQARSGKPIRQRLIWAPEVHWLGDRWALVHCPRRHSSLALSSGKDLKGPWTHPLGGALGQRHDPSLFTDDDGTRYLLWGNTLVAPLSADLTSYTAQPVRIDPAGSRPGPDGKPINRIGHEGATMIKLGGKYVHLGTAWSTDQGRKGSYNLYYCVADKITGPYGPRQFAGRFLGHGTPFKDKTGKWWCTAFFNGNVPPVPSEGIQQRDLGENAQTINEQGVTIVPLDVRMLDNGEVYIRAKDPAYAAPGPDEAQNFGMRKAITPFVAANVAIARSRLIVMADMGNEPDEEQQMMHLLMYANLVDLEGLIACSGKYLHADREDGRTEVHPELFHKLVDGYAEVHTNLSQHAEGWPEPEYLRSIIKAGTARYGIAAVEPGRSNDASKLIEASILKDDPRKLYIVGNAGTNTLAQALVDLHRTRTDEQMARLCRKIIVFENGAQDNSGAWIANRYPTIAWHRSNHQTYGYGGPGGKDTVAGPYTWEPFERTAEGQNDWAKQHIFTEHGPLGARFPPRLMHGRLHFLEGGGTIPWMGLVNHGLTNPEQLAWGGWSGRFSRTRHTNIFSRHQDVRRDEKEDGDFQMFEADSEVESWTDPIHGETFRTHYVPVWRFRRAMFNDLRGRMDWCVNSYDEANHNPVAAINGDASNTIMRKRASPGQTITLDASASTDPDGDEIDFHWWVYPEAGTYSHQVTLSKESAMVTSLVVPVDASGSEIHVVLSIQDRSAVVPMYDYRRVVISVDESRN